MQTTWLMAIAVVVLGACSGGSSSIAEPTKKDPVLWDCSCEVPAGIDSTATFDDEIPERERCGTTDPANALEDAHKGWACDPCTATATLCTKQ